MNDPFIISSIILSLAFLYLLIYNNKLKSKVIKFSFLILSIIYLILILIFDYKYVYNLLKSLITYLWYPNYLMFVTTIIFSIIILITSLLKKISFNNKIINYIFFCLNFICYISFIRLDIDVEIYSSYYDFNSLLILRISSISFIVWLIINIIFKFLNKRGKYEK